MAKDVKITLRVNAELRAAFSAAALLEGQTAANMLREFMRAYVDQSCERFQSGASGPISPAERRRHEEAVNFARASIGLEGLKPSETVEVATCKFINGEISLANFLRSTHSTLTT